MRHSTNCSWMMSTFHKLVKIWRFIPESCLLVLTFVIIITIPYQLGSVEWSSLVQHIQFEHHSSIYKFYHAVPTTKPNHASMMSTHSKKTNLNWIRDIVNVTLLKVILWSTQVALPNSKFCYVSISMHPFLCFSQGVMEERAIVPLAFS